MTANTNSRSYDSLGNLSTEVRVTGTSTLTTAYSYDAANRVASITYPSGEIVSYTRDIMGRVTSVSAQAPGGSSVPVVSSIAYEPFGPDTALTFGNGVSESRSFDQDYRLTALADAGTSSLQNLSYAYYPTNNVETITDAVTPGNSQSFSYDTLHRLTQAQGGYGSYAYTYDGDGNRQSVTFGSSTTTYGYQSGSDLLTSLSMGGVVQQTLGYTADGRLNSLNPGMESPGNQLISSATYNQDGRLASFNSGGEPLATYTYDGFGQRLLKTVSSSYGNIYQYDQSGILLEETNASGVAQADYIYLDGRLIATVEPSTGTLSFLHDDRLGTPQLATDRSQNIVWQGAYDPFGQTPTLSGTITQNLRLPGQYFDQETGFYHNGFRDYLPMLARYAEPDPLGRAGSGNNLYTYVNDNPTNLVDPLGLCPKCFAQLKTRPVDDWRAKLVGATHSFWYVQGSSGTQYIISGGPWAINGHTDLDVWVNQNLHSGVDNVSSTTSWNSGLSSNNCSGVDNLINTANNWPQNTIPYNPQNGPNSNSAAHNLGTAGGFSPPAPPGSIGWNTPIP